MLERPESIPGGLPETCSGVRQEEVHPEGERVLPQENTRDTLRAIPVAILRGTTPGTEAGSRPEVITGRSPAEVTQETTGGPGQCPLTTGGPMMIAGAPGTDTSLVTRAAMTESGAQSPGKKGTGAGVPGPGTLRTPGEKYCVEFRSVSLSNTLLLN